MSAMKVYVRGQLFDADKEPIFLIFEDDSSRKLVASQLSNMVEKEGMRCYSQHPAGALSKEQFDKLADEAEGAIKDKGWKDGQKAPNLGSTRVPDQADATKE